MIISFGTGVHWAADLGVTLAAACLVVPAMVRLGSPGHARQHGLGHELRDRLGSRAKHPSRELAGSLLLTAVLATGVMLQPSALPLIAVALPAGVLLHRQGLPGLLRGVAVIAAIAISATHAGLGPFLTMTAGSATAAVLLAQIAVLALLATGVLIGVLQDDRRRLDDQGTAHEQLYQTIAAASGDLILVLAQDYAASYVSPAARAFTGRSGRELAGQGWRQHLHHRDAGKLDRVLDAVRAGIREHERFPVRWLMVDGGWRWVEFELRAIRDPAGPGAPVMVAVVHDVTALRTDEEHRQVQAAARAHQATIDPLTGLADRREFEQRLGAEWHQAQRGRRPLSLLVIDLDHFARYEQAYGPQESDRCLAQVAGALRSVLPQPPALCARQGGQEFVALLPGTGQAAGQQVAKALCTAVHRLRIQHLGHDAGRVTISVGAATAAPAPGTPGGPDDGPDAPEQLRARAGAALRRAQSNGHNRAEVYTPELDRAARRGP